ncbi:MAG TPA: ATP-binding protein, partial [Prolixibacteraceae bacterium]|nr:ATP-binding protein [Prolixibacteraceae bacterium]
MISKSLYSQLIFRTLILVSIALAAGTCIALNWPVSVVVILLLIEVLVVVNLINYLNSTNRKLGVFLESIENEDSTLLFSTDEQNLPIRELYQSLSKVNRQIQQVKIESRQQEQYFQALLEQVATGIITFDHKGFVLHANRATKKMLGINVLTHINQLERVDTNLFEAIKNIRPFGQKLIAVTNNKGTIQISLHATSFKTNDSELIILSLQDIRNELDEKELDSWMKLIRVLMHEIMNSIAPITSLSESLCNFYTVEGRTAKPQEVDETTIQTTVKGLNVIREQGIGLMHFVESYRRLSGLQKPEKKIFRMDGLLNRIRILYNSLANSHRIELSIKLNHPEMELLADENLISQVLVNLLKNALQANDHNTDGRIKLVAGFNSDHLPEIRLSDNGPGIPHEILDQIFVPFFTTRENGSGIGLSLSRQIMQLHGGKLQVHSIPGKETI